MSSGKRRFTLTIWPLALGYFLFYAPYAGLIKATVGGMWPGVDGAVSGFRMMPAVVVSTAFVLLAFVTANGWWKYAGRRRVFGLSLPVPRPLVVLSGLGTAVIIGTTTLNFTFPGVSILLALVLMRGGVLLMGPIVDRLFGRRVRWFSWAAFAVTVPAIFVALADVKNYSMSALTVALLAAYLSGYLLRFPCVTRLAKTRDETATRRYFVEELMVAVFFLVALPAAFALAGTGEIAAELRQGFAGFFSSSLTPPALVIGALYAGLYCFGTLIYLDCRENTYCIPLNRGSSLLAGLFASAALALLAGLAPPSAAQVAGAALLVAALLLLSPLHHRLEDARDLLTRRLKAKVLPVDQLVQAEGARRLFLFVCSGNTCRSPMAAAFANAEIRSRLGLGVEASDVAFARAESAGVSAHEGAPMTDEARRALALLNVEAPAHAARNLTAELVEEAELIFCLTREHRRAVARKFPGAAAKTLCLDPEGDVEDPIGGGTEVYVSCAERISALVRWRLAEALPGSVL